MARSRAPGIFEASSGEGSKHRLHGAAAPSGQRGPFAPRSSRLLRLFFLQASEPVWRIFINLTAAFIDDLAPSGVVPGGMVDGSGIEVKHRRWRRTGSRSAFLFEVLFEKSKDYDVISVFRLFLDVILSHRYK
jgi:hypothetical protein